MSNLLEVVEERCSRLSLGDLVLPTKMCFLRLFQRHVHISNGILVYLFSCLTGPSGLLCRFLCIIVLIIASPSSSVVTSFERPSLLQARRHVGSQSGGLR